MVLLIDAHAAGTCSTSHPYHAAEGVCIHGAAGELTRLNMSHLEHEPPFRRIEGVCFDTGRPQGGREPTVMPSTSAAWLLYLVPDGELVVLLALHVSSLPLVGSIVAATGTSGNVMLAPHDPTCMAKQSTNERFWLAGRLEAPSKLHASQAEAAARVPDSRGFSGERQGVHPVRRCIGGCCITGRLHGVEGRR